MKHPKVRAGKDVTDPDVRPLLQVVKGDPSPQELAALVAIVAARASQPAPTVEAPLSSWAAPKWRVRRPLSTGPGAWRSFGRTSGTAR